jgi:drug/metabolite transporter (DMT)-like permease
MTSPARPWRSDIVLLLAVFIWGLNFPILKAALEVMHPHVINVFRFTISAVVLGAIYIHRQKTSGHAFWDPMRNETWRIVALGLLGFVLYQFFFIIGVENTAAGTAALIMSGAPVWTAIAGGLFRTERLRGLGWMGLAVSLIGTIVVVSGGVTGLAPGTLFGNLMMVGAALFWGLYTAFSRPVLGRVSPIGLSFFGLTAGLPILWIIGIPFFHQVDWSAVELWVWLAIFYSGALSTGVAVAFWNTAIRSVGASQTAAYNNLVPFVALLFSYLLIGEPITVLQVVGGTLIIAGLLVMRRARRLVTSRI